MITNSIANGLKMSGPRIRKTPKIPKPENPRHCVVIPVNCHTANISKYMNIMYNSL